jgi:hypothetical protein
VGEGPLEEPNEVENRFRSLRGTTSSEGVFSNGSSSVKTVPVPGSLETRICPSRFRTYRAIIARPETFLVFDPFEP